MEILKTLERWWRKLFGKPEGKEAPEEPSPPPPHVVAQRRVAQARARTRRGTSQFTGPGMRKLGRHRAGRQHEKRMGVDHNLGMRDVEDDDRRRKRR